jgi:small conductance mechanosensitive channel
MLHLLTAELSQGPTSNPEVSDALKKGGQALENAANDLETPKAAVEAVEKTSTNLLNVDWDYHLLVKLTEWAGWLAFKIFIALVLFYVGKFIIKRVLRLLDTALNRRGVESSLSSFLHTFVKVVLMVVLILAIIQTLGVNVSSFIALFASAGLAIGMALSGTLQNFAGGVVLLVLRPYKTGDFIESMGQ